MATKPTVAFGSATRDHAAKVYLGPEQAKVFYGMESPGPAVCVWCVRAFGGCVADGGLDEENRAHRLLWEFDPRVVRHKRQPGTGGVRLKRRDGRREAPGCDAKWNQGTLGTHRIDPAALHLSSPATEVRWFDGLVWLVEPVGDEDVRGGGKFLRAVPVPRDDTDGVREDGRPGFVRSISDHIVEVPQELQDREHLEPGRLPLLPSCQATDIISFPRTTPPSPTAARLDV